MQQTITQGSGESGAARAWKAGLLAASRLISFPSEREPASLDEIERLSDGWGTAVSEALDWTRGEW